MTRPRALLPLIALVVLAVSNQPAGAMIPEDLLTQRTVQSGGLSPDGTRLLFGIGAWDEQAGRRTTTWYVRDLAGEEDLVLFTPADRARGPVWRPDGGAIAYLRQTDEGAEVWAMDPDGGNRRRLSEGTGDFGALNWSPDGSRLAWITPAAVGEYEGEPGAYVVADGIGYRHLGDGYRQGKLQQLFVMDIENGQPRRLVEAELDVRSLCWSPDSQQLVFEAKTRKNLGWTVNTDLWRIDAAGGEPLQLTTGPGMDSAPQWLADGRLAWLRTDDPLWESAPRRLALARPEPEAAAAPQLLGEDLDALCWRFAPLEDDAFVLVAARRGCLDLVRVDEKGHRFLTDGGHDYWSLQVVGRRVLLSGAGQTLPGALFLLDLARRSALPRTPRILVDPNREWRARVGLVEPEHYAIEFEGRQIEGWFFRPPDAQRGERVPVVLSIHGGPEWMYGGYFLPEFHILPRFGYGVLIANPTGSMGYGFEFQNAIRGDWSGRPARELMACVDHAIARGWADPDRLAVMGGSYGGHLGAALTTQTDRFRAAALDRMHPDQIGFWGTTDEKWFPEWEFGGRPWEPQARETYLRNSPLTYVRNVTTPTLVSQGMLDYRCLIAGGETWFSALQAQGVPSRFLRFENEGHGIRGVRDLVFYHEQLLAWFDRHVLGPDETHEEDPLHE